MLVDWLVFRQSVHLPCGRVNKFSDPGGNATFGYNVRPKCVHSEGKSRISIREVDIPDGTNVADRVHLAQARRQVLLGRKIPLHEGRDWTFRGRDVKTQDVVTPFKKLVQDMTPQ